MEDWPPHFVTLAEDSVGGSAITTLFHDHKHVPADGWSAAMEYRLGRYLEIQPEASLTRVAVSCRPSRCVLQFMELPQTERLTSNAMTMLLRLTRESWYMEEFLDSGRLRPLRVATRVDAVQYMAMILNRRPML
jgi:hypothetical protein